MNELINKATILTAIQEGQGRYTITDKDDVKYTFFTTKQDGSETEAYNSFLRGNHGGSLVIGVPVQITYKEVQKWSDKAGKNVTYRNAVKFLRLSDLPEQKNSAPRASQNATEQAKQTDWDEIAVGKCQTAFLSAYIQSGKGFQDALLQVPQARKLAETVVYGRPKTAQENFDEAMEETLPTINQDEGFDENEIIY